MTLKTKKELHGNNIAYRSSLICCPKCKSEVKETWQVSKGSWGNEKPLKEFKLLGAICSQCKFDIGSIKQPNQ